MLALPACTFRPRAAERAQSRAPSSSSAAADVRPSAVRCSRERAASRGHGGRERVDPASAPCRAMAGGDDRERARTTPRHGRARACAERLARHQAIAATSACRLVPALHSRDAYRDPQQATPLNPATPWARPAGLEPATRGLEGRCSIQLSYGRKRVGSTTYSTPGVPSTASSNHGVTIRTRFGPPGAGWQGGDASAPGQLHVEPPQVLRREEVRPQMGVALRDDRRGAHAVAGGQRFRRFPSPWCTRRSVNASVRQPICRPGGTPGSIGRSHRQRCRVHGPGTKKQMPVCTPMGPPLLQGQGARGTGGTTAVVITETAIGVEVPRSRSAQRAGDVCCRVKGPPADRREVSGRRAEWAQRRRDRGCTRGFGAAGGGDVLDVSSFGLRRGRYDSPSMTKS